MLEHKIGNISETRKERGKITMEGLQELTDALSGGTISDPQCPPYIGGSQPHPELQSLLSQEWVKLRTSNLAGPFTGSIRTKVHLKFCSKGGVGLPKVLKYPLLSQDRAKL